MLIALAVAAALGGLAGTWSPCGLSAIDSLRPGAHGKGSRTTGAALVAFAAGALAGGAATFTALGFLGSLAGTHVHGLRIVLAVAVAAAAALSDLRGARVRPQVRRQVPEPWRRRWPLPAAAGAYGLLLGLGFTTYVLAFVLWASAAVTLALGSARLGLAAGLAFGLGRALPVVIFAPLADRPAAGRVLAAMAERPAVLLAVRRAGGVALAACVVVLALAPGAALGAGGVPIAVPGTDPAADGAFVAWQVPGGGGMLQQAGGRPVALPGRAPALGGGLLAYLGGGAAHVVRLATGEVVAVIPLSDVDSLAVSSRWLVVRSVGTTGNTALRAVRLDRPSVVRIIATAHRPAWLGRPTLDGSRVVWPRASSHASALREIDLDHGRTRTLLAAGAASAYGQPALRNGWLLYVSQSRCAQELRLRPLAHPRRERMLLKRGPLGRRDLGYDPGHTSQGSGPSLCRDRHRAHTMLWATALGARRAYVTLIAVRADASLGAARVVSVRR